MNREFIPKFSAMAVEQLERQQHVEFKTRLREDEYTMIPNMYVVCMSRIFLSSIMLFC